MNLYDLAQPQYDAFVSSINEMHKLQDTLNIFISAKVKDKILLVTGGLHEGRYARINGKPNNAYVAQGNNGATISVRLCHVGNIHEVETRNEYYVEPLPATFAISFTQLTIVGDYRTDLPDDWAYTKLEEGKYPYLTNKCKEQGFSEDQTSKILHIILDDGLCQHCYDEGSGCRCWDDS